MLLQIMARVLLHHCRCCTTAALAAAASQQLLFTDACDAAKILHTSLGWTRGCCCCGEVRRAAAALVLLLPSHCCQGLVGPLAPSRETFERSITPHNCRWSPGRCCGAEARPAALWGPYSVGWLPCRGRTASHLVATSTNKSKGRGRGVAGSRNKSPAHRSPGAGESLEQNGRSP